MLSQLQQSNLLTPLAWSGSRSMQHQQQREFTMQQRTWPQQVQLLQQAQERIR